MFCKLRISKWACIWVNGSWLQVSEASRDLLRQYDRQILDPAEFERLLMLLPGQSWTVMSRVSSACEIRFLEWVLSKQLSVQWGTDLLLTIFSSFGMRRTWFAKWSCADNSVCTTSTASVVETLQTTLYSFEESSMNGYIYCVYMFCVRSAKDACRKPLCTCSSARFHNIQDCSHNTWHILCDIKFLVLHSRFLLQCWTLSLPQMIKRTVCQALHIKWNFVREYKSSSTFSSCGKDRF